MRYYLHSHIFFIISIALHSALIFSFLSGSIDFSTKPEPFQATVLFESKPKPKRQTKPAAPSKPGTTLDTSTKTVKVDKPVLKAVAKKPVLKAKAKIQTATKQETSVSNTSIDELLKSKTTPVNVRDQKETLDVKKPDLLGYLRANKRSKKTVSTSKSPLKKQPEQPVKQKQEILPPPTPDNPSLTTETPKSKKPVTKTEIKETAPVDNLNKSPDSLFPGSQEKYLASNTASSDTEGVRKTQLKKWKKGNDIKIYRSQLAYLISSNWTKVTTRNFQILVEATIDNNGNLIQVRILKGSGLAGMDATAISALRKSTPFPRFPESFEPEKQIILVFRFTPDDVIY